MPHLGKAFDCCQSVQINKSSTCGFGLLVLLKGVSKPIYCIVAVAQNGVIGSQGRLPWHIPEDLAWFMDQTEGGVMIEGPNCYQELGKALPGRGTVVVSRNEQKSFPGAARAKNLNDAIALAQSLAWTGPIWITGGERIYAEGLPHCTKLYITRIHRDFIGDRYFPHDWSRHFTKKVWSKDGCEKDLSYTFEIWEK
jgi:dihydrofolate reductase